MSRSRIAEPKGILINTAKLSEVYTFQMPSGHFYSSQVNFLFTSCAQFLINLEMSDSQRGQGWAFQQSAHPGILHPPAGSAALPSGEGASPRTVWSQRWTQSDLDQRADALNPCDHLAADSPLPGSIRSGSHPVLSSWVTPSKSFTSPSRRLN